MDEFEPPTELTKTEARQGIRLHTMRQVLIFGTVGAMFALLIAGLLMT